MNTGIVIRSTGSWYRVLPTNGDKVVECRIVGKFRLHGLPLTNPVAVGDVVAFSFDDQEQKGLINEILPRRNYVARQSPRKKHHLHLLASNIDQAILIITLRDPKLKQGFIDRFLLMTEPHNIPVHIVVNKSDLFREKEENMFSFLQSIYEGIGYKMHTTSALEKNGVSELQEILKDKITLIGGQSGVGKSSLVNAIQPNLEIKTSVLSDYTGKGQHTTTFAEMHDLSFGGKIIDTPGIKTLAFNNLDPQDIAHNFRELFSASAQCKFNNCLHRNEPECNVLKRLESNQISELRYLNYITLLEESEEQNYWERKTDY